MPAALAAVLLAVGCGGPWGRPERAAGAALWVGPRSLPLDRHELRRLEQAGIGELFVEAGEVDWRGNRPRLVGTSAEVPGRAAATLVVTGALPQTAMAAEGAPRGLARALEGLKIEAEGKGLVPVGFHLDLQVEGGPGPYARFLRQLRSRIERSLFLSATAPRGWLDDPDIGDLARGSDFLLTFIYGERPGPGGESGAWDLEASERAVARLEEIGEDYLIGVVTLGRATLLDPRGEARARTTDLTLSRVLERPQLRLRHGFTLQVAGGQTYEFEASRPTRLGDWEIGEGERVRIERTATHYLAELGRRLRESEPEHLLGEVYYRLPAPGEGLSLGPLSLVHARSGEVPPPRIDLDLDLARRLRERWIVSLTLTNRGSESTELSVLGSNFAEIVLAGATFGSVEPGGFHRFELLRSGPGAPVPTFRGADRLRLFDPVLEPGEEVTSGEIEIRFRTSAPAVGLGGSFLLPDGRTLELPTREWHPEEGAGR